jgi:hypothetical protein
LSGFSREQCSAWVFICFGLPQIGETFSNATIFG